jgi:hypothetical protein
VVALHLLDDLNAVLADAKQGASHGAVLDRPTISVSRPLKDLGLTLTMWDQRT